MFSSLRLEGLIIRACHTFAYRLAFELRTDYSFIRSRTHNTYVTCISVVLCKFYERKHTHSKRIAQLDTQRSFEQAQNYAAYAGTQVIR